MKANVEYGFQPGQVSTHKTLILHAIVEEVSEIVCCMRLEVRSQTWFHTQS